MRIGLIHSGFMGMFIHCCTAQSGQNTEFGLLQTGQLKAVIVQKSATPCTISQKLCFKRWGMPAATRQTTDLAESAQLWALLSPSKTTKKPINQNVKMPQAPQAPHMIELGLRFMAQPRAHTTQWFEQQTNLIHGHLSRKARGATALETQPLVHFARANYQLNQQQLPDFMNLIIRLQQDFPHLKLQATGPWPPYSFPLLWTESQTHY